MGELCGWCLGVFNEAPEFSRVLQTFPVVLANFPELFAINPIFPPPDSKYVWISAVFSQDIRI